MNDVQKDRASLAVVLSVIVLALIVVACPIVGALIEGISKWESGFPH